MADVFKALAHPIRRDILLRLQEGPLSAGVIAGAYQVSAPTMSGHLAALKEAGLIDAERDGTTIRYRLNVSVLEETAATLMELVGVGKEKKGSAHEPHRIKRQRSHSGGDSGSGALG